MALSTLGAHTIAGRTFKCSEWTAGHLEWTISELQRIHPGDRLEISQTCYHTGYRPSAGTHDFDGVFDVRIVGMTWDAAQAFLRAKGWAAWHRTPQQGFADHIHMATIPPGLSGRPSAAQVGAAYAKLGIKVGKYIDGGLTSTGRTAYTSQVVDYFAHAFGLSGGHVPGSDRSWFPDDIAASAYRPSRSVPKISTSDRRKISVRNDWREDGIIAAHKLSEIRKSGEQPVADVIAKHQPRIEGWMAAIYDDLEGRDPRVVRARNLWREDRVIESRALHEIWKSGIKPAATGIATHIGEIDGAMKAIYDALA